MPKFLIAVETEPVPNALAPLLERLRSDPTVAHFAVTEVLPETQALSPLATDLLEEILVEKDRRNGAPPGMKQSFARLSLATRDDDLCRALLAVCEEYGVLDAVTVRRCHYRLDLKDHEVETLTGTEMVEDLNLPVVPL